MVGCPRIGSATAVTLDVVDTDAAAPVASIETLESVQRRVLWLATSIVHHANKVRTTPSGIKVGGHQASSASIVSIMTSLFFEHIRAPDRVSVKPHAAPVLHAINYLLGRLDERYLSELRAFGGLQSYPSRAKDPDPVDFSTASVGIGATATIFSALAHRYVAGHFEVRRGGRHIALLGDAELDEGAIWEALVDPMVSRLGEVLWIVDLNRQSLDRVVPDIAAGRIGAMFKAAGWRTITVKYGRLLRELFSRPGGEALRARIDGMPNEEFQRLLRLPADELRERLPGSGRGRRDVAQIMAGLEDAEVLAAIRNLGGHDLADLRQALRLADEAHDRPAVIFAYTIKAWRLPTEGHPGNHSALLSPSSGSSSPGSSARIQRNRGRASQPARPRRSCARRRRSASHARRLPHASRRGSHRSSARRTPRWPPPSRGSEGCWSSSHTRHRRSLRTW